MALPSLTLPFGFPPFLASGHEHEVEMQFNRTQFQTGHTRNRRRWTQNDITTEGQLHLDQEQVAAFFDWYENSLPIANGKFSVQVANMGPGLVWYEAEFTLGRTPTYTPSPEGIYWTVSCTLTLHGEPQVENPYTGALGYAVNVPFGANAVLNVRIPMAYAVSAAFIQRTRLSNYAVDTGFTMDAEVKADPVLRYAVTADFDFTMRLRLSYSVAAEFTSRGAALEYEVAVEFTDGAPPPVETYGSVDFQTADDTHYYQIATGPALPDADWTIGMWMKINATADETAHIAANPLDGTVFDAGSFLITGLPAGTGVLGNGILVNGSAGEIIPLVTDQPETLTDTIGEYLMIVQRRGTNYEIGWVLKGTAVPDLYVQPLSNTGSVAARRWDIGRLFYFSSTPSPHRYGDLFVLTNDSLSNAEIATLAAGNPITVVRDMVDITAYLKFDEVRVTEPDLTLNGYDATRVGTGFVTGAPFIEV